MKGFKYILPAIILTLLPVTTVKADNINYIFGREMTEEEINYQQQFEPVYSTYIEGEIPAQPVRNRHNELSRSTELEEKYDTRDTSGITAVKNQDYKNKTYGTCWAFATFGMGESNIMKKSLLNEPDLSEMHLAYFSYHRPADPLGGTEGDYNSSGNIDYRQIGGNAYLSIASLASWMGPVDESVLPYENVAVSDLNLKEDMAYKNVKAHLQNSYWISMKDIDLVKNMIKQYGSAQVSFRWSTSCYNYSTASYYKYESANTGQSHAVTIVGWDDNYSASNFKKSPESSGAWLVKNSWGDNWGDNGYFWMSYEDVSVQNATAFVFDYATADNYDYNYQYDGAADLSHYAGYGTNEAWMANVFEANSDEALRAVSFYLLREGMDYDIQIYKGITDEKNPVSGTPYLQEMQHGHQDTMGYYTVKLKNSVPIKKGEKFSVVIKLYNDYENVVIPLETTETAGYEVTAYSKAGQSFTSYNGINWKDRESSGNVRIKAFTDKVELGTVWNINTEIKGEKSINVTWDNDYRFDGYCVYRKESSFDTYEIIGRTDKNRNAFTDETTSFGGKYFYTVKGYKCIDGTYYYSRDSYGAYISIQLPSAVIKTKKKTAKGMELKWKKSDGASGYCIYRSTSKNGKYSIVKNVTSGKKSSCTDATVKQGEKYYYKVRAYKFINGKVVYAEYSKQK